MKPTEDQNEVTPSLAAAGESGPPPLWARLPRCGEAGGVTLGPDCDGGASPPDR